MPLKSYFGRYDRKKADSDKEIVNTIPLWRNVKNTEDLKERLDEMNKKEKDEAMPGKVKAKFLAHRRELQAQYDSIMESDPRGKMDAVDKARAKKAYKSFAEKLKDVMPTDTAMKTKDEVKPAELYKVAKTPCIKLDSPEEIEEARLSNLKISKDGKISKDDLVRAFENLRDALGENIRVAKLRRPGFTPAGRQGFVGYDSSFSEKYEEIFEAKPLNNLEEAKQEIEVKPEPKMWTCDLKGCCGKRMKLSQKGLHIGRYRAKKKETAILQEV